MVALGAFLALLCGVLNSAAAALEKHQGGQEPARLAGLRVLLALSKRPLWLLAMALSAVAWVAEAASLALAPVPVVASARGMGRGVLILAGPRWLGERFGRTELAGVVLATCGGVAVAASTVVAGGSVSLPPLPDGVLLGLGAGVALATLAVSRWRTGVGLGGAVGLLFAASGVYTKEIGDRVAVHGLAAIPGILASPNPWIMLAFTVWAQALVQAAFRQANAAKVTATDTTVSAVGLVIAGYTFYKEPIPHGLLGVTLLTGLLASFGGIAMMALHRTTEAVPVNA